MWFGRIGMVRLRSVFVVAPAAAASFLLSSTSSGVRIGFALADMEFDRDGYAYPPSTLGPSFEHPYSYLSPSETAASPDVRVSETLLKGTNSRTEDALASTAAGSPTNGTTGTDTEEAVIITAVPTTTATTASSPSNTQPCNLHLEFCTRSYGEITYVGAHNSPFVRQNNAASNQRLDVVTQLDDGIRMLQGQTHKANDTLYYCHTSCDLLNSGPVQDYLSTVAEWLDRNPFEIVTILIGNGGFVDIGEFRDPVEKSGLVDLLYVPPNNTLAYNQWPTLSEMILSGKRAVLFVDYKADEGRIPYILNEFSYMWETPFSQTDPQFPCTIDRPTDQPGWERKMYMANHNLNVDFSIYGTTALVPNTVDINRTNGMEGFGSLGLQANNCHTMWGRYPNFLLVDFYDSGNGSVFEVAARANNVTYPGGCCGNVKSVGTVPQPGNPVVLVVHCLLFLGFFIFG